MNICFFPEYLYKTRLDFVYYYTCPSLFEIYNIDPVMGKKLPWKIISSTQQYITHTHDNALFHMGHKNSYQTRLLKKQARALIGSS